MITFLRRVTPEPLRIPVRYGRALRARILLGRKTAAVGSIHDAVDLAFRFQCGPLAIEPYQIPWEIEQLLRLLEQRRPRRILEIGTAKGGTLYLFSHVAACDALLISVDLPGGQFGGGYDPSARILLKSFARSDQEIVLLRADSHSPETIQEVEQLLRGEKLDFLFIDGDHTLDGVRADFESYSPLVRKDGLIAFHDISPGPGESVGEVPVFWQSLTKDFRETDEIVESRGQQGAGIGLLFDPATRRPERARPSEQPGID